MKFTISLLLSMFLAAAVHSQPGSSTLAAASSSKGNYIFLYNVNTFMKDSALVKETVHFIIERVAYDILNPQNRLFTKIATVQAATTKGDLLRYFTPSQLADIKKITKLKTDEQVVEYFSSHRRPENYGLLYKFIETKLALGHVFLDTAVNPNDICEYRVIRVSKAGDSAIWGNAFVQSKLGNFALKHFKPFLAAVNAGDSTITLKWKMYINDHVAWNLPAPGPGLAGDKQGLLYRSLLPLVNVHAKVNVFSLNEGTWHWEDSLFPVNTKIYVKANSSSDKDEVQQATPSSDDDTLTFAYTKKCLPGQEMYFSLMIEDELYNPGASSDTTYAIAISNAHAPIIQRVNVKDTTDAILLSWKMLPAKPYITGIEIKRFGGADKADTTLILSPVDTSYTDRDIKIGITYRYWVKALYKPGLGLQQKVPAQGTGTYTVFSRPAPPYNVKATNEGPNIRLNWEADNEPAFFAYYVYRGTATGKLSLITGPLREKTYLDTAKHLTGRNQYFYAVTTQNLRQDTSIYSNVAGIVPVRKTTLASPGNMNFYYANRKLYMSWNDKREDDKFIDGYAVQRKAAGDTGFVTIVGYIEKPLVEDSNIAKGITYEYRVRSVNHAGESSEFGNASQFKLEKEPVSTISVFYVTNVDKGIEVSFPAELHEERRSYNIYRRKLAENKFTKLASVDAAEYAYIDSSAEAGNTYVYSVSITETDGREGALGAQKPLKR